MPSQSPPSVKASQMQLFFSKERGRCRMQSDWHERQRGIGPTPDEHGDGGGRGEEGTVGGRKARG